MKTNSSKKRLWLVSGYQGMAWKKAKIPVDLKEGFQVRLLF
jgi:hypothetical protein